LKLDEIRESFGFFDDWEDKYRFIIDLGKSLPALPEADRNEENLVRGCQSQVWLKGSFDAQSNTLALAIDSDAHIVRGLISVVLAAYEGLSPEEIRDHDTEGLFEELELLEHLSPTRGNGLRAMVSRIKQLAREHCPMPDA
jgi:cysteine desulfuration protein SufE